MAYDSPFRRHGADRQDPTSTLGLGDQPRLRGQPGFHAEPDPRVSAYPSGAYQGGQGGHGYQDSHGYQQSPGYQAGAPATGGYRSGGHQPAEADDYSPPGSPPRGHPPGRYQAGAGSRDQSRVVKAAADDDEEDLEEPAPGRDRLVVHWIWEALLLVGVGAVAVLLWQADSQALRGGQLSLLLVVAAGWGLLGIAAGLSLRAAAPNLAIGPVAVAAGVVFAQQGDVGVVVPLVGAVVAAVVLGVVVAILVVVFHVPGWVASLAAAAAAVVWLRQQPDTIELAGGYSPNSQAAFLLALVVALGVLGGLLGTLRGVREAVGRFRPEGDPAQRRGPLAAAMTSGAIVLSMALAAAAGVLLVAGYGQAISPAGPVAGGSGVTWLEWTLVGFAVALVGGTSAFGRRGGVFGTSLAVVGLVLFHRLQAVQEWQIALLATAATAIVLGLVVTRVVEAFGGRKVPEAGEPPAESPAGAAGAAESAGAGAGAAGVAEWTTTPPARAAEPLGGRLTDPAATSAAAWSSALPARPAPGMGDPWDDERWNRR